MINNIAAYLEGLSATTCSKLIQLFSSMSSPSFLLANETNHRLLRSLLEAMNAIIEHQYESTFMKLISFQTQELTSCRKRPIHLFNPQTQKTIRSPAVFHS